MSSDGGVYDRKLIKFVKQRDDWDCGVACAQMVLSAVSKDVTRDELVGLLKTQVRSELSCREIYALYTDTTHFPTRIFYVLECLDL
jgi:ABC-type bacteriocin/lantibiotic exporter with double-glycine peptidase domain